MSEMPLRAVLERLAAGGESRFYMPGHKGEAEARNLLSPLLPYDVTETGATDNLYFAEGAILESEQNTAEIFGVAQAYYSVNGCTGALHTAMQLAARGGRRFLLDRNCHRSVINGAALFDLETDYLLPRVEPEFGVTLGYRAEDVARAFAHAEYDAVVLTSPTYYGVVSEITEISRVCHEHGALLIVDCAHGAHFGFSERTPKPPWRCGADLVAVSAHKTLPVLTQGAYLFDQHGFDRRLVESCMATTCSSSPSYLLMASLEYGAWFMKQHGTERMEQLLRQTMQAAARIGAIGPWRVLQSGQGLTVDPARLVIGTQHSGMTGFALFDRLAQQKVVCEMADDNNVVLLPSVMSPQRDFERLITALEQIAPQTATAKENHIWELALPQRMMSVKEARQRPFEYVPVAQCAGRISAEIKGIYPPGVCAVAPGELIDVQLQKYLQAHFSDMIRVLCNEGGTEHETGDCNRK